MAMKITNDVLESHLKCRYKGYLKLAGEHGRPSDSELLLREVRDRLRLVGTDRLLIQHKGDGDEVLRGTVVTPAVLKHGVPLFLDATMGDKGLSVCFDALQKTTGTSKLGNFHYIPALFHEVERPPGNRGSCSSYTG